MGFLSTFLKAVSGSGSAEVSKQLLFDKVIGFRGISSNVGVSITVQNLAIALSKKTSYSICVLDTNFIKANQFHLLGCSQSDLDKSSDILTFNGDVSSVVVPSKYSNVYVAGMKDRGIADSLSGKDSEEVTKKLLDALKVYFDIILVDLSCELTNVSVFSAIKCNRIFLVMDTSFSCLSGFQKALDGLTSMGISPSKCREVLVMKDLPNLVTGIESMIESAGCHLFGSVPLSAGIASLATGGAPLYGVVARDKAVAQFADLIDAVFDEIVEKTVLNAGYLNMSSVLKEKQAVREAAVAAAGPKSLLDDADDDDDDDDAVPAAEALVDTEDGGDEE